MTCTAYDILKKIKDKNIRFVDLRFTDLKGKLHHITISSDLLDEDKFMDGITFNASSIPGWKAINDSDMILIPDPESGRLDPFFAHPTYSIICNVFDPVTGRAYNRDPRSVSRKCEAYLESLGIGDTVYVGPEAEFFIFDDVHFEANPYSSCFRLDSREMPYNSNRNYEAGNLAHRPRSRGGYVPLPPVDPTQDIRSEMLSVLSDVGISVERHHHEMAPGQNKLGIHFDTLMCQADKMQIVKYVIHQVANSYGKTATFMPKPIFGDNGSGMHIHLSVWKEGRPIFAGDEYAGLSESALYFIGGVIKHAKALNAFTNPTINSYKRLLTESRYETPVPLSYSAHNRFASCRVPFTTFAAGKRIEIRFPDPSANPYLAFSALVMAGLDGITNKFYPGDPIEINPYDLPVRELKNIPAVSRSLHEALESLDKDRAFLKVGEVFDDDSLDSFIALKMQDIQRYDTIPHPIEYDMYYSV